MDRGGTTRWMRGHCWLARPWSNGGRPRWWRIGQHHGLGGQRRPWCSPERPCRDMSTWSWPPDARRKAMACMRGSGEDGAQGVILGTETSKCGRWQRGRHGLARCLGVVAWVPGSTRRGRRIMVEQMWHGRAVTVAWLWRQARGRVRGYRRGAAMSRCEQVGAREGEGMEWW
jgi:hypothetical protein